MKRFLAPILLALMFVSTPSWGGTCNVPSFQKFTNAKWNVDEPHYYDDSRLGFSFAFNAPLAKGTFYVYDLGISSDLENHWKEQFRKAVSDIFYRYEKQEPDAKLSNPIPVPNRLISHIKFINDAAFIVVLKKNTTNDMTIVSIGMINGCFHKFRYTQLISSSAKSDVAGGLMGFAEIVNSIQDALLKTDYLQ